MREPSVKKQTEVPLPSLWEALLPVGFLVMLLVLSVKLYSSDSSYGPNQIALILSAGVACLLGMRNGLSWKDLENAMVHGISLSMGALFILLVVGSLIGTWILAGIVPTMIYYGLQIMHPSFFYVASCLICALVALGTGSSWTTASTIGIALIGIATALDLNLGMTAGSIISGAYFGDKLSPLSDTTNLAPAMAGTDLFTHIRHMLWTTVPSLIIACTLFLILGFTSKSGSEIDLSSYLELLRNHFNVSPVMLVPPLIVLGMVMKKVPAFPALLIGALVGGVFAILFQQGTVLAFVGDESLSKPMAMLKGCWTAMFGGFSITTENAEFNKLLSRGGMTSMLNTVWLIISAMMFGAVMERTRSLEVIAGKILGLARSTGTLVSATLATSIGMNIVASDQYIAIVIPGRMFRAEFENRQLAPQNLSRCLEDSGTLTSPLIPWNTCGAYMATTLGVATGTYWMYCFFNILSPFISAFYGFTGFTIVKTEKPAVEEREAA
ncbi:Na+/H+ antiporter NhaC [Sulfidibacter corallicola]|uniref:Na+/H+ antiporter NhaC n=1 Tax=Sulfidibacter corallicola TaxID=2818388 RepID=A0A8A4TUT6_SULCO|nr:Na+/H+ antiporter NhaC [Sulfidibacter corallicola]QTD52881.1 Na+/H+ antiporter NhaC [Sulfidibacter corallicola]